MKFQPALRLQKLPTYIFTEINKRKQNLKTQGRELIDLGMGDPDLATPLSLVECLRSEVQDPSTHHYPPYAGIPEFKEAVSNWMQSRFSVEIDPQTEALNLIGSKEGLAHFFQAVLNPGDHCLLPDPGYPVYINASILAGATPVFYDLKAKNNFQPDWSEIPEHTWQSVKMIVVNFPHNPTGATLALDSYRQLVEICKKHNVIICSDTPYSEMCFDHMAPCCLQVEGAKDICIEFFSLSKTYNMTGWRIGFAVGNSDLIASLLRIKSSIDTGVFIPIQKTAIAALRGSDKELVNPSKEVFQYRRSMMITGLESKGYDVFDSGATFYLWMRVPTTQSSADFCFELMEKTGIVATPGSGFGKNGEGFFRFSLTVPEEQLQKVIELMPEANPNRTQSMA